MYFATNAARNQLTQRNQALNRIQLHTVKKIQGEGTMGINDRLNEQRAQFAENSIAAHARESGLLPFESKEAAIDLLANIGHWCERNGLVFQEIIEEALENYHFEGMQENE